MLFIAYSTICEKMCVSVCNEGILYDTNGSIKFHEICIDPLQCLSSYTFSLFTVSVFIWCFREKKKHIENCYSMVRVHNSQYAIEPRGRIGICQRKSDWISPNWETSIALHDITRNQIEYDKCWMSAQMKIDLLDNEMHCDYQ